MEKKERLMSLDALRGFDMLWIMGLANVVTNLCTLIGAKGCWLAQQMTHVEWHGFHHHDTIFPLFLFLAGASWPFSFAGQVKRGYSTGRIVLRCLRRMVVLCLLGVFFFGFFRHLDFGKVRYDSILAHIGICWYVAALVYMFVKSWKARLGIVAGLLVVHGLILGLCRAPDAAALLASTDPEVAKKVASYAAFGTDNFSFVGNVAGWIERTFVPGKLYEGIFDPDGVLAKITGIALAMLGVFAGELLRQESLSGNRKTLVLAGAGVAAVALTLGFAPLCPVNKKIWTSTFVLASAGYAYLMLALFYWIIDVKGLRKWAFVFMVVGMNSITIYLLMKFIWFGGVSKFFLEGVAALGNGAWNAVVIGVGQLVAEWLVLWYLYRKGTFLRV